MTHTLIQKLTTEFIGTFLLSFTICASGLYGSAEDYAPFIISFNLMIMIYAGRHISGAHYNPVITITIYLRGIFDKNDILPYIVLQIIAAVSAALVVERFSLSNATSSEIFSLGFEAIIAELIFTFIFAYVVLHVATTESTLDNNYYGAAIALVIFIGAITVGSISLASFNPAVTSALIISGKVTLGDSWMHFIPQLVGAILATYLYRYSHRITS
ncbi:MAG: aquaporin [Candidatus Poseidoniales archaeon]|nr:aquaporin [Candidatus Poseidoniales archaeon]